MTIDNPEYIKPVRYEINLFIDGETTDERREKVGRFILDLEEEFKNVYAVGEDDNGFTVGMIVIVTRKMDAHRFIYDRLLALTGGLDGMFVTLTENPVGYVLKSRDYPAFTDEI